MHPSIVVTWLLLPAAIGYALVAPSLLRRHHAERPLPRWTTRVGLPAAPSVAPRLTSQLLAQRIGADVGGALGMALAALWGISVGRGATSSSWWPIILLSSLLVGVAVGNGAGAFRAAMRPVDERSVRIARPTVPTLGDYVPRVERRTARLVALAPVVLLIALLVSHGDTAGPLPVLAAAASLAVLVTAEVGSQSVLRGPQPAASDLELAWQDAVRAHTLRSILAVPVAIGAYACAAVLSAFQPWQLDPRGVGGTLLVAAVALILAAGIALLVWTNSPRPHQHVLQQLWPEGEPHVARSAGEGR